MFPENLAFKRSHLFSRKNDQAGICGKKRGLKIISFFSICCLVVIPHMPKQPDIYTVLRVFHTIVKLVYSPILPGIYYLTCFFNCTS